MGILVSFFTKPPQSSEIKGLTVYDAKKLKEIFKGSPVNEDKGEKTLVDWELNKDSNADTIQFSKNDMEIMKANPGDLVYLCDNRGWLGGLKSIHSLYGEPHDRDGIVIITSEQQQSGLFDQGRKLFGEKEM